MDSSNQPTIAKVEKVLGRTGSRGGVIQVSSSDLSMFHINLGSSALHRQRWPT